MWEGGANCVWVKKGCCSFFRGEEKKTQKKKSALFTNKFHCLTRSQRQEFTLKGHQEVADAARTVSSDGKRHDPQRPLVFTASPCRTVLKYGLLAADCCFLMPSHPDCCLSHSITNPPKPKN